MTSRSTKQKPTLREGDKDLLGFLVRNLPPCETEHAQHLANVIRDAAARYDRYKAKTNEWMQYKLRRQRLKSIIEIAHELTSKLGDLDILSRDELAIRLDPKEVDALVGSLMRLGKEMADVFKEAQTNGRPRDLAEERWILEVAEIYETVFSDTPDAHQPMFRRLLELSRPKLLLANGKLNPKQVGRALKRRKSHHRPAAVREMASR